MIHLRAVGVGGLARSVRPTRRITTGYAQPRRKRVPSSHAEERQWLDGLIFQELCVGVFRPEARAETVALIDHLRERGAEAVILGCTELPLIIAPDESPLPLIDTTRIHAAAAVDFAL